jgi:hypothetical protein
MKLSLKKFENFAMIKNFIVLRYYAHKTILFCELLDIVRLNTLFVTFPPRTEFTHNVETPIVALTTVEADGACQNPLKDSYADIAVSEGGKRGVESVLHEQYRSVLPRQSGNPPREVCVQLGRLNGCLDMTKYSIVVVRNNHLCTAREIYALKSSVVDCRGVCTDLSTFYDNQNVDQDLDEIRTGLEQTLDQTNRAQAALYARVLKEGAVDGVLARITTRRQTAVERMRKAERLYQERLGEERRLIAQLNGMQSRGISVSEDIHKTRDLVKTEERLRKVCEEKEGLMGEILQAKGAVDRSMLELDQRIFTNAVMLSTVLNNVRNMANESI